MSHTAIARNDLPQLSGSYWVSRLLRDRDAVLRALAAELLARLMQPGAEGSQAMVAQVRLGERSSVTNHLGQPGRRSHTTVSPARRGICFSARHTTGPRVGDPRA